MLDVTHRGGPRATESARGVLLGACSAPLVVTELMHALKGHNQFRRKERKFRCGCCRCNLEQSRLGDLGKGLHFWG
jgi:hypothetical protein